MKTKTFWIISLLFVYGTIQSQENNASSILFSTPYHENIKAIKPHFTEKTKVILLDETKNLEMTGFNEGIAFIKNPRTNRWGAIDTLGNKVFDFKFQWHRAYGGDTDIPYFHDGVFPTWGSNFDKPNGMVLVNKKGEIVKHMPDIIQFTNFINGVASGIILVVDKQKSSQYRKVTYPRVIYFNTKGELIYPNISFDCKDGRKPSTLYKPSSFINGLSAYYDYAKKRWGYINKEGKIIIPAQYQNVKDFSEGMAAVMNENNYWGFIDPEGNTAIEFRFSKAPGSFRDGISIVEKREGKYKVCMMDTNGNIVKENLWSASNFFGGISLITYVPENEVGFKYGLLHRDLKTIEPVAKEFPNNWYYQNGIMYLNGYSNHDGGVLSRNMHNYLLYAMNFKGPFQNELASCLLLAKDGSYYGDNLRPAYINMKGEVVIVFEKPEF